MSVTIKTHPLSPAFRRDALLSAVTLIISLILFFLPTGFGGGRPGNSVRSPGRVLSVDNSQIQTFGLIRQGDQNVTAQILSGPFKGEILTGNNILMGSLELDKIFQEGEKALMVISYHPETGEVVDVVAYDHYRLDWEVLLLAIFALLLLAYAGMTGLKALLSFVFTALMIGKILLPGYLRGYPPQLLALGVVAVLTGVIIFLIAGVNRKGLTAFLGGFLGISVTALLALIFGGAFMVHGAVLKFSETLLYSGYPHLNLTAIFQAGIFIAASGAVMDLAMDIAASMQEIKHRHPGISRKDLVISGFRVGRAVMGTMTTTLLLAYSSGFSAMFMVFIAQGTPLTNVFNINYVSAEVLHTLVGSFGLITVAPFTAMMGGLIFGGSSEES